MSLQIVVAEAPQNQAGLPAALIDAEAASWANGRKDLDFTRYEFKNNTSSKAENFCAMLKEASQAVSERV